MNRKRISSDDDDFEEEDDSEEGDDEYSDDENDENDEDDEESDEEDEFDDDDEEGDLSDESEDEESDEDEDDSDDESEEDENEFEEGRVFVIMQFRDEKSQDVFSAIEDECSKLDLNAEIASRGVGSGLVVQEIYSSTSEAEFIICDLTGERPNVYYELGQAHGLGNDAMRILLIAEEGTQLHFDIAPFRVRFYQSTEHLRTIVSSELERMIQLTRS
jgi:hypothetical protein